MRVLRFCRAYLVLGLVFLGFSGIAPQALAQDRGRIEIVPNIPHSHFVSSIAFSPDGARVLSGSRDKTLKLLDVETGQLIRTFEGHSDVVNSVAFSPDGARLLSGSNDKKLKIWDVATGRVIRTLEGHSQYVTSVAFSPDGTRVLSGSHDKTLKLWETETGQLIRTLEGHASWVLAVGFSPDGARLLSGSYDNTVKQWDAASGQLIRTFDGHSSVVNSVAFSPDGARIVSGSADKTLKLWAAATGQLIRTLVGHADQVVSVAFSPDGTRLLSGSGVPFIGRNDTLKLWDTKTGRLIRTFERAGVALAFSPDGMRILATSSGRVLKLWDATTGRLQRTFQEHTAFVGSVAFSPDGRHMLSRQDATLKLWDPASGQLLRTLEGHAKLIRAVAFSRDGARVLSGSWDKTLKLWDVATGQLVRTFEGHADGVESVTFSPDGALLLSGSRDKTLKLWDAATGQLLRSIEAHAGWVRSVAFSSDGMRMLSGGDDKKLKIWDAVTGQLLHSFEGHPVTSLAYSPDGTRIVSGGQEKTPKLWDVATGALIRTFEGHSARITSVAFSSDGARIVSASDDATIRLWDAGTGQLIHTFKGHAGVVTSVAISPDGARVFSGSDDSTLRIWDAGTGAPLATLIGGRNSQWLTITPAGFFDASDGGLEMVAVVRGLDVFAIDQFREQLQRKDLLHELLTGDVLRKHEDEASKLNLERILDSGPAPTIELLENEIERAGDTVRLRVRIFNNAGGGIGKRLIWRVNDQAQGETEPEALKNLANSNGPVTVTQALMIDASRENIVSVIAYNGAGLLPTLPLRTKIDRFGATPVDQPRPRMFIVAIGVNGYSDPALTPLMMAVGDVKALARNLKASAEAGGYEKAEIIERIEADATKEQIAAAFADISGRVKRQDALIVLLAGHGKSVSGRYYYLPAGTRFGGTERRNVTTEGIATEVWERWIASIQLDKKLLIIDTCESSDFIPRGSKDELARETAVDRLRRSIGNSVITAARQAAYEGSRLGHGVLTYAVLEALAQPVPGGGDIDVEGIHQYVRIAVPRLSAELSGQVQEPFNRIVGNFPIGAGRIEATPASPAPAAIQPGRYVLLGSGAIPVRARPEETAEVNLELDVLSVVQVFKFADGWTLIGRGGTALGYVPASAVQRLKE